MEGSTQPPDSRNLSDASTAPDTQNLLLGRAEPIPAPAAPTQLEATRNAGVAAGAPPEITKVGVLDHTALEGPEALDGVRQIRNVGVILVPQPLVPKLSTIPAENVGTTIPVPAGAKIKAFTGATVMSGEALANVDGDPNEVLLVTGSLAFTSPVRKVGYQQFIVSGSVLAPEGSEAALGAGISRMTGSLAYYPYSEGAAVRVRTGFQQVSGAELANPAGQESDILLVLDTLAVTSQVDRLGYQHLVVVGSLIAPPGSEAALTGRVTTIGGQVVYSDARPRVFNGRDELARAFFEYLDEPVLLIVNGRCTFEDDVTVDVLKEKLKGIILNGRIDAPRAIVPIVQALTLAKNGRITASDDPRQRDRDAGRGRDRDRD
jgi:hypothetical protein